MYHIRSYIKTILYSPKACSPFSVEVILHLLFMVYGFSLFGFLLSSHVSSICMVWIPWSSFAFLVIFGFGCSFFVFFFYVCFSSSIFAFLLFLLSSSTFAFIILFLLFFFYLCFSSSIFAFLLLFSLIFYFCFSFTISIFLSPFLLSSDLLLQYFDFFPYLLFPLFHRHGFFSFFIRHSFFISYLLIFFAHLSFFLHFQFFLVSYGLTVFFCISP